MNFGEMPSSHFLFIPSVLLIGVVIGWVLGDIIHALRRIASAMEQKQERGRQSW